MATITPPRRGRFEEAQVLRVAAALGYRFEDLVGYGFIEGGSLLSYGCTVTGLAAADGVVAFNESILGYPTALSASTVYLCSSSASDTGTYKIHGIDANGDYAEATATATGTTPVAFSGTWNHVQRCISTSADNVGTVYVSTDAAAIPTTLGDQIQVVMNPGTNYAVNPMLWVPNDHLVSIHRFDFNTNTNSAFKVVIEANRQGMWIENFVFYAYDSQFGQDFYAPIILREGDKMRVKVSLATGTGASATFGMNGVNLHFTGTDNVLSMSTLFQV